MRTAAASLTALPNHMSESYKRQAQQVRNVMIMTLSYSALSAHPLNQQVRCEAASTAAGTLWDGGQDYFIPHNKRKIHCSK
jgi:hypothetical protein